MIDTMMKPVQEQGKTINRDIIETSKTNKRHRETCVLDIIKIHEL